MNHIHHPRLLAAGAENAAEFSRKVVFWLSIWAPGARLVSHINHPRLLAVSTKLTTAHLRHVEARMLQPALLANERHFL